MPSDLLRCPECGAALDCYSDQMTHWEWHRNQRARLTELEGRIEVLERVAATDRTLEQEAMERE